MLVATRPLTYEDIPTPPPDSGERYELIGGEIVVTAAPAPVHQRLALRLIRDVDAGVVQPGYGELFIAPTDVWLTPYDTVIPDLFVIATGSTAVVGDRYVQGPPDLIVEILSPSTKGRDRVRKAALYATHGVPEYWLVDPETKSIAVLGLNNGRYEPMRQEPGVVRSALFPSLTVDLAVLFAGL
ncbi:MAG: Uma2 family endonuclease [Thermomicrobiales bacterium]